MTNAATVLARMRALPEADLTTVAGTAPVLILAPHQDDEVIGCGGLIATLVQANRPPHLLFVTDGAGSHPNSRLFGHDRLVALRREEAREAAAILGLSDDHVSFMNVPDTKAPHDGPAFAAAVGAITSHVKRHGIGTILAPWRHDPHGDHLAVHRMAVAVSAATGVRHLSYPVWGWTLQDDANLGSDNVAGWRLDVRDHLDLRHRALMAHRSQTTSLIPDDPTGFRLDTATLGKMLSSHETFLSPA